MTITQWDPAALPKRPGLYINFKKAAQAIVGGSRGTVGLPIYTFSGTLKAGKFATVESELTAIELLGEGNEGPAVLALQGGAKDVLVYAVPDAEITPAEDGEGGEPTIKFDAAKVRGAFDTRQFNVFTYGIPVGDEIDSATKAWVERNGKEKKHFLYVTGGTDEEDTSEELSNARTKLLAQDTVINATKGGSIGAKEYSSGTYTPYYAGLIAGTPLNGSTTYAPVALSDVNYRMTNKAVEDALDAGSFVIVHDGDKVKVEQGITTSGDKIRKVAVRQAVATDVEKTAREHWIGKITNNDAGQAAIIGGIKVYLETLEAAEVLTDISVRKSALFPSEGDKLFIDIAYTELDSLEYVFLTISPN